MSGAADEHVLARAASSTWHRVVLGVVVAGVVTVAVYEASLAGFFLSDDLAFVDQIAGWQRDGRLLEYLGREVWEPAHRGASFFRPIVTASFGSDWLLWGVDARGWRAMQLCIHLASLALLWRVVRRLEAPSSAGLAATAAVVLFALRPTGPETVGWIADRTDALCLLGMLIAVLGFLRAQGRWNRDLALALAGFALALGSKEAAMTLPGCLAVVVVAGGIGPMRERAALIRAALALLPFAALLGLYLAWRTVLFGDPFGVYPNVEPIDLGDPSWRAARLRALRFFVAPGEDLSPTATLLLVATAVQLAVGAAASAKCPVVRRLWVFGMGWMAVTVFSMLHVVAVEGSGIGLRLFYVPSVGLAVALAAPLALRPTVHGALRVRVAIVGAVAVALFSVPPLLRNIESWRAAGAGMRALVPALAALADATPQRRPRTVVVVPDQIDGALFGRNAIQALIRPPIQPRHLGDRLIIAIGTSLWRDGPGMGRWIGPAYCWSSTSRELVPLHVPRYEPDAWTSTWRDALISAGCHAIAIDAGIVPRQPPLD